jgi:NAD-dependent deacetylase
MHERCAARRLPPDLPWRAILVRQHVDGSDAARKHVECRVTSTDAARACAAGFDFSTSSNRHGDVDNLLAAVGALRRAKLVLVATGAGMSRESGIPTFRDALTGLWPRYDPEELATEAAFRRHPARVFGWYLWRRELVARATPHAGYAALVALEGMVPELVVVTQNVDGLHRRAGTRRVIELHGSLDRFFCRDARHPFPTAALPQGTVDTDVVPPACPECGAPVRPGVVWFGEALPERAVDEAWDLAARCDVMLVVGTSGLVHPAAGLPVVARDAGATLIEVNPAPSEITAVAHVVCRGAAGAVLPALVAGLRGEGVS